MYFSNCRLKFDVVSAFSLVQDFNTSVYERLLSTRVANVARVALSQTYAGWWASFEAQRCCREWASFSAQFWKSGISFLVQQPSELSIEERNLLSGANKFPSCRCCSISVHVLFVVVDNNQFHTARKSSTDLEQSRDLLQTKRTHVR